MKLIRIISLILAIILVLGLAATGVTAFAAENTLIDNVRITVNNFAVGKSTADITFTLPDDANYTIKSYTVETEDGTPFSGTLGEEIYGITIIAQPNDGYAFDAGNVSWNVAGDDMTMAASRGSTAESVTYFAKFDLRDMSKIITKIEATISGMEVGKPLSGVTVTAPAGANYNVAIHFFSDRNATISDLSHVIGNRQYTVYIVVTPKEGYTLLEDDAEIEIHGNGLLQSSGYIRDAEAYSISNTFDFGTPIDKVNVTITGMEEGKSASDVKVTVPADAHCSVDVFSISSKDSDDYKGTFYKDSFANEIFLAPADGYRFTDDTVITVNGSDSGVLSGLASDCMMYVRYKLELRTFIEKVDITVTGMEKGNDTSAVKATVPANANYTVDVNVLRQDSGSFNGKMDEYNYTVELVVYAKEGFYLDEEETVVRCNGAEPDYVNDQNRGTFMFVEKDYFFGEYIDKVELPAWPTAPKVGDTVPAPQMANTEKYSYVGVWASGDSMMSDGDTFESDRLYTFIYLVFPADGYAFAENVKVTVGGKTNTGSVLDMSDILNTFKSYRLGDPKVVDTIKLSGAVPTAGNAPGTITPVAGTGYKVGDTDWGVADNGKGSYITDPGSAFKVGDYVYMGIEFQLAEGYELDLGFKVQYNGKSYSPMLDRLTIDDDGSCIAIICLGQLKAASNPDTGDETNLMLLSMLAIFSLAIAAAITIQLKKRTH